jgi:hypothetical protein
MCEILLRIVDRHGDDFYHDCKVPKAGEVDVVVPDGWPWGRLEIDDPTKERVIVSLPGVSVAEAQLLVLHQEADPNGVATEKTLSIKAHKLDLTGLTLLPWTVLNWTPEQLKERTIVKPYVADPAHRKI